MKPSLQTLREKFLIDESQKGLVFRKDSGRGGRYKAGSKAGYILTKGQRVVCVDGKYFMEAQIVWALHHGEWPDGDVALINGDKNDNRPSNLYLCTNQKLTIERLKLLLSHKDGKLFWNVCKPPFTKIGDEVLTKNDQGYLKVGLDGRPYRAHRIIWALVHDEFPEFEIDHIDGDRSNNKIENLRLATHAQNMQNSFTRSDNKTGCKGVHFRKDTDKYSATIQINGLVKNLGCYDTFEEAKKIRLEAEEKFHPYRKAA